jgi:hypothetical protein
MNQKEVDSKILLTIKSKLAVWAKKPLSTAARILASNQLILASIWYIASCADISLGALTKVKTLVRNYIWSSEYELDKTVRAKVGWHSAILPTVYGGIKYIWSLLSILCFIGENDPEGIDARAGALEGTYKTPNGIPATKQRR